MIHLETQGIHICKSERSVCERITCFDVKVHVSGFTLTLGLHAHMDKCLHRIIGPEMLCMTFRLNPFNALV